MAEAGEVFYFLSRSGRGGPQGRSGRENEIFPRNTEYSRPLRLSESGVSAVVATAPGPSVMIGLADRRCYGTGEDHEVHL